ncbi:MAG: peptidoglycan-binding protein [Clostridia bacterium]|nr:peptidoglycan-binding protein [Clostridia bacterium]
MAEDVLLTSEERTEQLRHAQQMLIDLGYLVGNADGMLGPHTAEALRAFQARNGLEQTGELDGATLMALDAMAETVQSAREIQQRLIELNYMGGSADGIFGERSQRALRQFQAMNGLEATGELDDATRAALFSEDAQVLPRRLTGGDRGEEVEALQQRLAQFGFLSGEVDGVYGAQTSAAVTRFQRHLIEQGYGESLDIVDDGVATAVTQALLFDDLYSSYIRDVAPGDEGSEVLRAERRLNQLGYMDMAPDEVFDEYSVRAASQFRLDARIGEGDVLDSEAFEVLFSVDAPVAEHYVPHDIASGDSGLAVRDAENALIAMGMLVKLPDGKYSAEVETAVTRLHDYLIARDSENAVLFEEPAALSIEAQAALQEGLPFVRELSLLREEGEDGEEVVTANSSDPDEVLRLQRRLYMLYFLGKYGVDGIYGETSAAAVTAFQAANGLPETGVADRATQERLFSQDAVCDMRPYRIEVDISKQRVFCYQLSEAGEYELVRTCVCSTGLGNTTPRGIFLDGFPVNRWHYFSKFHCWAQYSFVVEGDIMFHSVLYSDQDTSTLRTGSLYALGSKASHGCIRLKVEDAKWLFTNCKRGSLVILIY